MGKTTRIIFVATAVAIGGLVVLAATFVTGRALSWSDSLSPGELTLLRAACLLASIAGLVAAAIARYRRAQRGDPA